MAQDSDMALLPTSAGCSNGRTKTSRILDVKYLLFVERDHVGMRAIDDLQWSALRASRQRIRSLPAGPSMNIDLDKRGRFLFVPRKRFRRQPSITASPSAGWSLGENRYPSLSQKRHPVSRANGSIKASNTACQHASQRRCSPAGMHEFRRYPATRTQRTEFTARRLISKAGH